MKFGQPRGLTCRSTLKVDWKGNDGPKITSHDDDRALKKPSRSLPRAPRGRLVIGRNLPREIWEPFQYLGTANAGLTALA